MFRNIFSVIIFTNRIEIPKTTAKITFASVQKYIKDTYNVDVSKSSITQVKNKCCIDKLEKNAKNVENITLKSEKEKLVFETFKHFEIV